MQLQRPKYRFAVQLVLQSARSSGTASPPAWLWPPAIDKTGSPPMLGSGHVCQIALAKPVNQVTPALPTHQGICRQSGRERGHRNVTRIDATRLKGCSHLTPMPAGQIMAGRQRLCRGNHSLRRAGSPRRYMCRPYLCPIGMSCLLLHFR